MGTYFTRTRAWVYIAFYDEYVGRHINTSAGLTLMVMIPLYWYGQRVTRGKEYVARNTFYMYETFPQRNRLLHNMIMEQFEMHVEEAQDAMLDVMKNGEKAFYKIPPLQLKEDVPPVSVDELALIDEISGYKGWIDTMTARVDMPEAIKERWRATVATKTTQPKDITRFQMHKLLVGDDR